MIMLKGTKEMWQGKGCEYEVTREGDNGMVTRMTKGDEGKESRPLETRGRR